MSTTNTVARRLLGLFSLLSGDRGSGAVRVIATGAPIVLEKGEYLAPIANGQADYQRLLVVSATTTVASGAGTLVPVVSMLGGTEQTFPVGTVTRFDPPIEGLQPTATVETAISGATSGTVKQVSSYEQLGAAAARDLFSGKITRYPAVVLSWNDSSNYEPSAKGSDTNNEGWVAYVVVSRVDATERRAREGLDILDELEELLVQRTSFDGLFLSRAPIRVQRRGRLAVTPQVYVYTIEFETSRLAVRRSLVAAQPWLTSRVDVPTGETPSATIPVVVDNRIDMTS